MFIIDGKDLEHSVLSDQDPTAGPFQNLFFSPFFQYLIHRVSGLYFGRILVNLNLHLFNGILEGDRLLEKIRIDDSDFGQTVPLILFGLQGKKPEKPVDIHLVVSVNILSEEPSHFLLRGHQGWF